MVLPITDPSFSGFESCPVKSLPKRQSFPHSLHREISLSLGSIFQTSDNQIEGSKCYLESDRRMEWNEIMAHVCGESAPKRLFRDQETWVFPSEGREQISIIVFNCAQHCITCGRWLITCITLMSYRSLYISNKQMNVVWRI